MPTPRPKWIWHRFLRIAAAGALLILAGWGLQAPYLAAADDRVATGVEIAGEVVRVYSGRGQPSGVTVRYEYGEVHTTTVWQPGGAVMRPRASYRKGEAVLVYLDRDDPSRAALPGGYTSDLGRWVATLPPALLGMGIGIGVIWPLARRFGHRMPAKASYAHLDLDRLPDLSVELSPAMSAAERWLPVYHRLTEALPREPGSSGLRLRVILHLNRRGESLDFRDVRVGPLSRKRRLLIVDAVIPSDRLAPDEQVRDALARAVAAALAFASRKDAASRLPDLHGILHSLPPPSAEERENGLGGRS